MSLANRYEVRVHLYCKLNVELKTLKGFEFVKSNILKTCTWVQLSKNKKFSGHSSNHLWVIQWLTDRKNTFSEL